MRRLATATVGAVLALGVGALPGYADSTSPGKSSAYESATISPLGSGLPTLLTATIVKGKKKKVLAIEASLVTGSGAVGTLELAVEVNGLPPQGQTINETCDAGTQHCTLVGTWWLDIDVAEAANPGQFVKQPIEVTLKGGVQAGGDSDIQATATLSVRMESK
jgi:hypothetical protein